MFGVFVGEIMNEQTDMQEVETKEKSENEEKCMMDVWTPFESFEEMEKAEAAKEKAQEIRKAAEVIPSMIDNVVFNNEPSEIETKIKKVFSGFMKKLKSFANGNKQKKEQLLPIVEKEINIGEFTIFKGKDNQLLWLSSYSNNIRDNDSPPEIIASESHAKFVSRVDDGEVDLPELWLWHEEDWNIGKASVVAYDHDAGAAIAAGFIHKEAEPIAVAIDESDIDWGVSHGMPSMKIRRSKEDPTIIIEHITKEISPLPHFAAANKFAGFTVLKEANMALKQEKRSQLEEAGIPVEALDNLEAMNKTKSDVADELELERKEQEVEPEQQDVEPQEDKEVESEEQEVAFSEKQLETLESAFGAYSEKLAPEIVDIVKKTVEESMKPYVEEMTRIKETEAREVLANTPPASISDLLFNGGPLLKAQSVTESDDAKVDGRTTLAKSKPEEVDFEDDAPIMGNPLSAAIIKGITSGDYKKVSA